MYLLYYGVVRIIMEPLRRETYIMRIFGNVSFSILTSALFILAGVGIIIYLEINRKKLVKKEVVEEPTTEDISNG